LDAAVWWIGHQLRAECEISVPASLTVGQGHDIAVDAKHRLIHAVPGLGAALVHADPQHDTDGPHRDPHAALAGHR
jgi:divalent metal cation (Fe/Co/Zn/Cd) transporter